MSQAVAAPTAAINLGGGAAGQFEDTTYTEVFVEGLAWETQKETMKRYFEQFGDILEAIVITDKATGRSQAYGFKRSTRASSNANSLKSAGARRVIQYRGSEINAN